MALNLLIENPAGARTVIDPDALPQHESRDWHPVGLCTDPSRDPLLTDQEFAAALKAEAARIAALLKSDAAPATSRPSK